MMVRTIMHKASYLQGQSVLVTGATDLVGSNLLKRLLRDGATVRATLQLRPPVVVDDRIEYISADLTNGEDCRRVVAGQ